MDAQVRTRPTTICWNAESKPSSTMPDCSDWMTNAPMIAP